MPDIAFKLTNECNGGCHGDIIVVADGVEVYRERSADLVEMFAAGVSQEDWRALVRIVARIERGAKTDTEVKDALRREWGFVTGEKVAEAEEPIGKVREG